MNPQEGSAAGDVLTGQRWKAGEGSLKAMQF